MTRLLFISKACQTYNAKLRKKEALPSGVLGQKNTENGKGPGSEIVGVAASRIENLDNF